MTLRWVAGALSEAKVASEGCAGTTR